MFFSGSRSIYFQESISHTCCRPEILICLYCCLLASYKSPHTYSPLYVTILTAVTGSARLPAHTHSQSAISHTDPGSVYLTLHSRGLQSEIGQGVIITSCEEAHPYTGVTAKAGKIIVRFCTCLIQHCILLKYLWRLKSQWQANKEERIHQM